MKNVIVMSAAMIFLATGLVANATPQTKADATAIDSACQADASTAGCGSEVVGKGLLKCLGSYKRTQRKANKSFAYSPGCETAIKQLRADKTTGKMTN